MNKVKLITVECETGGFHVYTYTRVIDVETNETLYYLLDGQISDYNKMKKKYNYIKKLTHKTYKERRNERVETYIELIQELTNLIDPYTDYIENWKQQQSAEAVNDNFRKQISILKEHFEVNTR